MTQQLVYDTGIPIDFVMQCVNFGTHIVWNSSSVYFMLKFTEDFLNRLSRVVQRKASYGEIYQVTSGDGAPLQVVQKKPPPWIVSVKKKRRRRLSNLLHYWQSLNLHILHIRQMYSFVALPVFSCGIQVLLYLR